MTTRIREAAEEYATHRYRYPGGMNSPSGIFEDLNKDQYRAFQAGAEWAIAEVVRELCGPAACKRCLEQDAKDYHYHSTDWADWLSSRFKGE